MAISCKAYHLHSWKTANSKHWLTTSLLQPVITPYIGIEKLSANAQFFIGAQISVSLYQIIPGVSFRTTLGAYASCAQLKPKLTESRWNFFTQGGCASC